MFSFGLVGEFWLAAVTYSLSYSLRIASSPLFKAWINQIGLARCGFVLRNQV
jgi:hypothetical protein